MLDGTQQGIEDSVKKEEASNTAIFKMNNQQGPAVHRDLCSVLYGSLDGRGVWGRMDTCICKAEVLPCSPETITNLLVRTPSISRRTDKKLVILTASRETIIWWLRSTFQLYSLVNLLNTDLC